MQKLDYSPITTIPRYRRWCRRFLTAIAIIVSIPILFACWQLAVFERENDKFEAKTSESRLVGLTPAQVISLIGPPDRRCTTSWEGYEYLFYNGPGWVSCRVDIEHGVVTGIKRFSN